MSATLRPLDIGEIFDRAVTLFVRNYRVFLLLGLIPAIPGAVLDYAGMSANSAGLVTAGQLTAGFLRLIAAMGAAVVIAQLYERKAIDLKAALKSGLWNIPGALGLDIIMALIFFLPAALLFGLALQALRAGNPVAIGFAIAVFIAIVILVAAGNLAMAGGIVTLAVESSSTNDAIGRTLSRFFGGAESRKALLMALALLAVEFAAAFAVGFLRPVSLRLTGSIAPAEAFGALVHVIAQPLCAILVAVYYFDVRIRREAFDLDVSLEDLETAHT